MINAGSHCMIGASIPSIMLKLVVLTNSHSIGRSRCWMIWLIICVMMWGSCIIWSIICYCIIRSSHDLPFFSHSLCRYIAKKFTHIYVYVIAIMVKTLMWSLCIQACPTYSIKSAGWLLLDDWLLYVASCAVHVSGNTEPLVFEINMVHELWLYGLDMCNFIVEIR